MSSYEKHIFGYLFFVIIALLFLSYFSSLTMNLEILTLGSILGLFYTLLPDIDLPHSKLRGIIEKLFLAAILCSLLAYLYLKDISLIYLSLGLVIFLYFLWFSKHRQIFHSPLLGTLLSLPWYFLSPFFFAFALFGFLSHLLIDGKLWE